MEMVYLSIGSNMYCPLEQINNAIQTINKESNIRLISCSSYYHSFPMGPQNQPNFLNVVILINTIFTPKQLLFFIQDVEVQQGRIRKKERWGPRTLDIDILLFGNRIIKNNILVIPHYDMLNRNFVLYPLAELKPNLLFPNNTKIINYINKISNKNLYLLKSIKIFN